MRNHLRSGVAVLLLVVGGCGAQQEPTALESQAAPPPDSREATADGGTVTFEVELTGGEHAGTYRVAADNRCMAIVNTPGAQLNVNALDQESALRYAQISLYGMTAEAGQSEDFILIARLADGELRIDTHPGSLIGNSGGGKVSWQVEGRRQIVISVAATTDDGIDLRTTVTCTSPSWTGI